MNADGSAVNRLTDDPASDRTPAWSPDGERIAFASDRDGTYDIYAMNADTSGRARLTESSFADDFFPDWSPDGTRIALLF